MAVNRNMSTKFEDTFQCSVLQVRDTDDINHRDEAAETWSHDQQ